MRVLWSSYLLVIGAIVLSVRYLTSHIRLPIPPIASYNKLPLIYSTDILSSASSIHTSHIALSPAHSCAITLYRLLISLTSVHLSDSIRFGRSLLFALAEDIYIDPIETRYSSHNIWCSCAGVISNDLGMGSCRFIRSTAWSGFKSEC